MWDKLVRIDPLRARRYRDAGLWGPDRVDETVLAPSFSRGGELALVSGERTLTHGELRLAVNACAKRLKDNEIRRGDLVIVQLPNDIELVVLTLALSKIGAAPVLTPTALREYELDHVARITRPVAMAVPARHARYDHFALARRIRDGNSSLRTLFVSDVDSPDAVDLTELCALPGSPGELVDGELATLDDPALCLLSNGTTGPPKVIPRLQEAYGYQLRTTPGLAGVGPGSVYLAVMPATHGFVLGCPGVLGTLGAGGTVVLGPSAEPEAAFALIEQHLVTHCTLVPALAERWADAAEDTGFDLTSLEVIQVGGARPRPGQVERIPAVLGCVVQQCYGMSEGLLNYTPTDADGDVAFHTQGMPASPADEIRVLDDSGRPVPPGGTGQLLTRGPYTVGGYYGDPDATAGAFTEDGFYRTGDLVSLHPSGSLVVEGRSRDVVNRGGEKIPAAELELLAAEHPGIAAAAVVAAPHPRFGEIVCLYVVPQGDWVPELPAVRRFLQERGLARFKLPERMEVLDEFPYLGIGKVDKTALRADLAARPS